MNHIINHTKLGFCLWDIVALLILLGVISVFLYKRNQMKKEEERLMESLEEHVPKAAYSK